MTGRDEIHPLSDIALKVGAYKLSATDHET